jgi:hypothetical protein
VYDEDEDGEDDEVEVAGDGSDVDFFVGLVVRTHTKQRIKFTQPTS